MIGGVAHTLDRMRGAWRERVEVFAPDGAPLAADDRSGSPGPAPYERLVYVDFDGAEYRQTNVAARGGEVSARTFAGAMRDGVLVFRALGPGAPEHIGVSGGAGVLVFTARELAARPRYHEPDWIYLMDEETRIRTTVLYRDGVVVRTLTARGARASGSAARRVPSDPRGAEGTVHEAPGQTEVFR